VSGVPFRNIRVESPKCRGYLQGMSELSPGFTNDSPSHLNRLRTVDECITGVIKNEKQLVAGAEEFFIPVRGISHITYKKYHFFRNRGRNLKLTRFTNSIRDNSPRSRLVINVATAVSFFTGSERFFQFCMSLIFAYTLHWNSRRASAMRSSTKHSSTSAGCRHGRPKKSFKKFPISLSLSLYSSVRASF